MGMDVVLVAMLLAAQQGLLAQGPPGGPVAVGVVRAEKKAITETSEFVGRVQAVDRVDLTARVTAFVGPTGTADTTPINFADFSDNELTLGRGSEKGFFVRAQGFY